MSSGRDKIDAGAWGGRLGTAARKRWKRGEERSKNQQRAEDNIGEQRRTEACTQSTHTKYFITKENKTHKHTHTHTQNLSKPKPRLPTRTDFVVQAQEHQHIRSINRI